MKRYKNKTKIIEFYLIKKDFEARVSQLTQV